MREYPALWLPVIVADVAAFALRSSRRAAALSVFHLLSPMFHGHSVLAGSSGVEQTATATTLITAFVYFVGFVLEASSIVVYAIALFITARMVWERVGLRRDREKLRTGAAVVGLSIRGLLVAFLLGTASAVILWGAMNTRWHARAPWWVFSGAVSALMMSVFAYVMTPPALRLLADSNEEPAERSVRLGRRCAVAAVLASVGLMILEHFTIGAIYGSHAEIFVIRAIASLIAALPYAPLYIALSLLARVEPADVPSEHIALVPGEVWVRD